MKRLISGASSLQTMHETTRPANVAAMKEALLASGGGPALFEQFQALAA